jgi:hypothetical protein
VAAEAFKRFDDDTWHDAVKAEEGKAACIGTGVARLPDTLKVDDDLNLRRNTNVTKLPNNLKVRFSLDVSHTGVTKLPDILEAGGGLDVSDTRISKLPDNFEVGMLDLSRSGVRELPNNLKVRGNLYMYDTAAARRSQSRRHDLRVQWGRPDLSSRREASFTTERAPHLDPLTGHLTEGRKRQDTLVTGRFPACCKSLKFRTKSFLS